MMLSKISSTPFRGTISLQARDKVTLKNGTRVLKPSDIEKIDNYGFFSIIEMGNKKEYMTNIPYENLMMAYKLASDSRFDADVKFKNQ